MKKLIVLILALCLVLSLAACGSNGDTSDTDAPKTEAPATEAPKTEAPATDAPATEAPATDAPATEATTTEAPAQQQNLAHGIVDGNVYTNESLNLKVTAPEGYRFYNDEELAAVNNQMGDYFASNDLGKLLEKSGYVIDMFMADETGDSINLTVQPYDKTLDAYDDETLFTMMENTYKSQFAVAGMELKSFEVVKTNAFGEDTYSASMKLAANGSEFTEYQLFLRNGSEYYGILTLTAMDDAEIETLLASLSHIN